MLRLFDVLANSTWTWQGGTGALVGGQRHHKRGVTLVCRQAFDERYDSEEWHDS